VPPDQAGQGSHGTLTLSEVAGVLPGTFSGVAFGCSVALAKTEYVPTETPVEMDNWQFGAEWADSLGADVISSSLGYNEFDSPWPSYTYADMDGRTTVITLAAVEAMRRGITVVNSAGNEAAKAWHFITAPADADTVLTIGAVDSFNVVTNFSSRGPSFDGRTKPDVTAMGNKVLLPSFNNDSTYARASGTSFSCPLTAGVVAMLLQAHPAWGPWEVREALRSTALNHANPDNNIGWGLVQGMSAFGWAAPAGVPPATTSSRLAIAAAPNPLRSSVPLAVRFSAPRGEKVAVDVLDLAGRRVAPLYSGAAEGGREARWDGLDRGGFAAPAGIYWVRITGTHDTRSVRVALLR
jgi:subtilisin family serine protease